MSLLTWNETMMLGIGDIDRQHQRWIELINALHEAMHEGKGSETINETLAHMLDYTRVHFVHEERLLLQHSYPGYTQHKQLHDNFISQLKDVRDRLENGHIILTMEVMRSLRNWLKDHIQNIDRQYAPFLKGKGVI
jgi:hemerythrin-like metal-binding protein